MHKGQHQTNMQWHTAGNLALANDLWDERENWQTESLCQHLSLAQQELTNDIESDPHAAAKDIAMGIGISITLLCVLGHFMFSFVTNLDPCFIYEE